MVNHPIPLHSTLIHLHPNISDQSIGNSVRRHCQSLSVAQRALLLEFIPYFYEQRNSYRSANVNKICIVFNLPNKKRIRVNLNV